MGHIVNEFKLDEDPLQKAIHDPSCGPAVVAALTILLAGEEMMDTDILRARRDIRAYLIADLIERPDILNIDQVRALDDSARIRGYSGTALEIAALERVAFNRFHSLRP